MSLITTGCAQYCNLVDDGYTNVLASDLKVGGVSGAPWQTARLSTSAVLGSQRTASREIPFNFALQPGDRYKIIIGMDILEKYNMVVDIGSKSLKCKIKEEKI